MANTPTPHIGAQMGEIAERVIMAGDPLRAKFMAERYLENPVQFNSVRGMLGYTGTYKGKRVSVMGHGMGIPSIGIYTYELYNFYGVKRIIRTGSAGAYHPDLQLGDVVVGIGACTDSNYGAQYKLPGVFAPTGDFAMARAAVEKAEQMGVLAVEMEAAALYMNAARSGNQALCICTISDSLVTGEACSAEQRQTSFTNMMHRFLLLLFYLRS